MKHKKIIILSVYLLSGISTMAQIIVPKEKSILEIAYNKTVSIDTVGGKSFHESPMVLRVGKTSSMFYPEKRMFIDSLNYYSNDAGYDLIADAMMSGEPVADVTGWEDEYLFRNIYENVTFVCNHFASYYLGYKEDTELPEWRIDTNMTKQILGYECIYASCHYRGREWEVWFTPEIPISEGPWKLAGLPGIILKAVDKKGQYIYDARSVSTQTLSDVGIFLYHRKNIDMMKDRKSYLKALYHLRLKGKFMNEVSVYTDFKMSIVDKVPRYDFEETDYPHD